MQNEIIINADPGETRIALLERSVFTELHIERDQGKGVVGNIVKGRVSRVLPGMQAAFVDVGLEKAAFLYVGDYYDKIPGESEGSAGGRGRGRNHRGRPPNIENVLTEGDEIVVQIAKEPIGSKGARITSNISIPGRHLVLTPWSARVGVSRRIGADRERKRLREIVDRLRPKELGFIIRTAGDGVREADLEADIRYLSSVWEKIQRATADKPAPAVLHEEHDLPLRIIRDLASHETDRIVIDNEAVHASISAFVEEFVADPKPSIERWEEPRPIFESLGLEAQIHANLGKKVWLKSGGSLVVDQSEALTAIDVNTGRFVGKRDLEETVFKTNLEAVKEVVNQVRFRNIGGLIIIDLIDMESNEHREKVYRALQEAVRSDKARTNILKISELGLVEMTRKRTRENLVQTLCEPCAYCEGRGYVLSGASVAYNILREVRTDLPRFCGRRIAITVAPRVAEQLLGPEAKALAALAEELGREIEVRARPGLHQEQFEVVALDQGPAIEIPLRWLRDPSEIAAEEEAEVQRKAETKKKSRARRRSRGRGRKRGEDADEGEESAAEGEAAADTVDEADEAAAEEPEARATVAEPSADEPPADTTVSADAVDPDTAVEADGGPAAADGADRPEADAAMEADLERRRRDEDEEDEDASDLEAPRKAAVAGGDGPPGSASPEDQGAAAAAEAGADEPSAAQTPRGDEAEAEEASASKVAG